MIINSDCEKKLTFFLEQKVELRIHERGSSSNKKHKKKKKRKVFDDNSSDEYYKEQVKRKKKRFRNKKFEPKNPRDAPKENKLASIKLLIPLNTPTRSMRVKSSIQNSSKSKLLREEDPSNASENIMRLDSPTELELTSPPHHIDIKNNEIKKIKKRDSRSSTLIATKPFKFSKEPEEQSETQNEIMKIIHSKPQDPQRVCSEIPKEQFQRIYGDFEEHRVTPNPLETSSKQKYQFEPVSKFYDMNPSSGLPHLDLDEERPSMHLRPEDARKNRAKMSRANFRKKRDLGVIFQDQKSMESSGGESREIERINQVIISEEEEEKEMRQGPSFVKSPIGNLRQFMKNQAQEVPGAWSPNISNI